LDVSLHATSCSIIKSFLSEIGAAEAVEVIELPELCRMVAKDYTLPLPGPRVIRKPLPTFLPKNSRPKKSIHGFISELTNVADEAAKPFDRSSILAKLLFPVTHRAMWGIRKPTPAQLLDKHVKDPELRALLWVFWGYYPCSTVKGIFWPPLS